MSLPDGPVAKPATIPPGDCREREDLAFGLSTIFLMNPDIVTFVSFVKFVRPAMSC
jgi:hypothetical protein